MKQKPPNFHFPTQFPLPFSRKCSKSTRIIPISMEFSVPPMQELKQIPPKIPFPTEFPLPFSGKSNKSRQIPPKSHFPQNSLSVSQEMKQKQKAQEELSSRPPSLPLPDVVPDGDAHLGHNGLPLAHGPAAPLPGHARGLQQPPRNHGLLGGALANLFVIVGFAAFAYTVKYVLRSIAQE